MQSTLHRSPGRPRLQARATEIEAQCAEAGKITLAIMTEKMPPISRFTLFDMATWGDWLCERFELQWPGKNRAYWQGKVNNLTASNDVLFIKNDDGVLLIAAS